MRSVICLLFRPLSSPPRFEVIWIQRDSRGLLTLGGDVVQLVICLLCSENPFACPEFYRTSHMMMHLVKKHGVEKEPLFANWGTGTLTYSFGRGRHAEPVLKQVEIKV